MTEFFILNDRRHECQEAYAEYWNAFRELSKSGRAVDFVVLPGVPANTIRPGHAGGYLGEVLVCLHGMLCLTIHRVHYYCACS